MFIYQSVIFFNQTLEYTYLIFRFQNYFLVMLLTIMVFMLWYVYDQQAKWAKKNSHIYHDKYKIDEKNDII